MATPTIGAAFSAAGLVPAGFGVPATADERGAGRTLGALNARYIAPHTGDYELDANGRMTGMTGVQQRVQLALMTALGSSAMAGLGINLTLDRATDDVTRRVQDAVEQALASMVQSGEVQLVAVSVQRAVPSRLVTRVSWRDLSNGSVEETVI